MFDPSLTIDQKDIDIAFIRFWGFFESDNIGTFNHFINPKVLIPMHYLYDNNFSNITEVEDSVYIYQDSIPETFIFRDYLESKIFQFNQSTTINRRECMVFVWYWM